MENLIAIDTETHNADAYNTKLLFITKAVLNSQNKVVTSVENVVIQQREPLVPSYLGHNTKFDALVIKNNLGIDLKYGWDTLVAEYLLNPHLSLKLEDVIKRRCGIEKDDLITIFNKHSKLQRKNLPERWFEVIPEKELHEYALADVAHLHEIQRQQETELADRGLLQWYLGVEHPVTEILTLSELNGVRVDKGELSNLRVRLQERTSYLQQSLKELAGDKDFNVNSSKQLQTVMFKQMGMKPGKRTKTGFSTDHKELVKLQETNDTEFLRQLLEYKEINKVLTTYTTSILEKLDENDRLHTTYNQCFTATRRLSSSHPNLQNIPVKSDTGKLVKQCFIPKLGYTFLDFDFDQIELRLLAHFSEDETLIKWFTEGVDIHQKTGDLLFKEEPDEKIRRQRGKILNFSLMYGKTEYGFAKDWGVSEDEARDTIEMYFYQFPKVKTWMEAMKYEVLKNKGWVTSLAGLPLFTEFIIPSEASQYTLSGVYRKAVNYPIQCSSQDIFKTALVNIHKKLELVPVLMVHDSLTYEVPKSEAEELFKKVQYEMEHAWQLKVPLTVKGAILDKWGT